MECDTYLGRDALGAGVGFVGNGISEVCVGAMGPVLELTLPIPTGMKSLGNSVEIDI